jgi:hypothetical protein
MENKTSTTTTSQSPSELEPNTKPATNVHNGVQSSETNDVQTPSEARSPRTMKPVTWLLLVFSLLSSDFLFALDNTIVADVQPKIILALGNIEKLPWVSVAFALGAIGVNHLWYEHIRSSSMNTC